jgi:hypothetical protein
MPIRSGVLSFGLVAIPMRVHTDPPGFVYRHDLTVDKRIVRQSLTGTGDIRELLGEQVAAPRPKRYAVCLPASEAAVAVELDLVEPVLALRQFVDQPTLNSIDLTLTNSTVSLVRHMIRCHYYPRDFRSA